MSNVISWILKHITIFTFLFHLKFTRNDVYQFPTLLHKLQGFNSRKHFADHDYIASFSCKSPDFQAPNVWRIADTCVKVGRVTCPLLEHSYWLWSLLYHRTLSTNIRVFPYKIHIVSTICFFKQPKYFYLIFIQPITFLYYMPR
jgi:hypothetical protein